MYLRAAQMARGDYLASHRGDPGLFGFLGGIVKKGLGLAGGLLPGPLGGIARFAGSLIPGGARMVPSRQAARQAAPGGLQIPVPGIRGMGQRAFLGGATGWEPGRRRRRMNPGNVKALRRAMRRQDSFVKLARRALKGSKYKITTVGSGSRRRPLNITESGPGGVTVGR